MSWFFLALLLASAPLLGQTAAATRRAPPAATADDQIKALQDRARKILNAELSRKLGPACHDPNLSNAEQGRCFDDDEAITYLNYRAFAAALKALLAIEPSDVERAFHCRQRTSQKERRLGASTSTKHVRHWETPNTGQAEYQLI